MGTLLLLLDRELPSRMEQPAATLLNDPLGEDACPLMVMEDVDIIYIRNAAGGYHQCTQC